MNCVKCGGDIPVEQAGRPCPTCGSLDRRVAAGDSGVVNDSAQVVASASVFAQEAGACTDEAVSVTGEDPAPYSSWRQQWDRVLRWYWRMEQTATGRIHIMESDHYQDELYAFFQNCWHLKDWVKNDPSSGVSGDEVETFANGSEPLCWSADLCNGSKHLRLTSPRIDPGIGVGRRHFNLALGGGEPSISVSYEVGGGSNKRNAMELATACLEEWRRFLNDKHLLK